MFANPIFGAISSFWGLMKSWIIYLFKKPLLWSLLIFLIPKNNKLRRFKVDKSLDFLNELMSKHSSRKKSTKTFFSIIYFSKSLKRKSPITAVNSFSWLHSVQMLLSSIYSRPFKKILWNHDSVGSYILFPLQIAIYWPLALEIVVRSRRRVNLTKSENSNTVKM